MKEPKIRFKGFRGEWEKKKLGAMTSVRGGYAFQSSLFQKSGIPVVRISNILSNGNVGGDFVYYPRLDGDTNITIHEKDVVIAMSGATTGKIARVDVGDGILYQNQRVGLFTKTGKVDYDFLYTVLNRPHFNELLNKLLTSSAQPNASSADIESIEMEFPEDAEEQKALSNYILSLDSLIQSTTKKIESLKQVKTASLQSMFPQEGETTPRVRFKGFEGEWEKVRASNVFKTFNEKNRPNLPVLSATQDRGMVTREAIGYNIFHDKSNEATYKHILPGQFIIHLRSFQGGFAHSAIEGIASPAYTIMEFRNKTRHFDLYWKYIFMSKEFIKRLELITYGIRDGRSISFEEFSEMYFTVPSYEEQQKIASYFTTLDRQISLQTQRLEKLKQIKAACLDNMFV